MILSVLMALINASTHVHPKPEHDFVEDAIVKELVGNCVAKCVREARGTKDSSTEKFSAIASLSTRLNARG